MPVNIFESKGIIDGLVRDSELLHSLAHTKMSFLQTWIEGLHSNKIVLLVFLEVNLGGVV